MSTGDFDVPEYPRVDAQVPFEIMNYGKHYNNDNPLATIRFKDRISRTRQRMYMRRLTWVRHKDNGRLNN